LLANNIPKSWWPYNVKVWVTYGLSVACQWWLLHYISSSKTRIYWLEDKMGLPYDVWKRDRCNGWCICGYWRVWSLCSSSGLSFVLFLLVLYLYVSSKLCKIKGG
jgi:hypothetical protein